MSTDPTAHGSELSFVRYLAAKQSVDDRALNRTVWETLAAALPLQTAASPLTVLEIGAGVGTMVERALTWGLLTHADYTAIDAEATNIAAAAERLVRWGAARGYNVHQDNAGHMRFVGASKTQGTPTELRLTLQTCDLFDLLPPVGRAAAVTYDLLIAHAFLDLVPIPAVLPRLAALLRPNGLCYFTINFDGVTTFQPELDPLFDAQIERLYHRTMDERIVQGHPSGDSRSGRHLFGHMREAGLEVLAAGASDWVVYPRQGGYPGDEAAFLHFIVRTVAEALAGHPELNPTRFAAWIAQRHAQIEQGELVYIAHQLDMVGRVTR